ncbi:threonine dehydrogenase-like Zn-dependent dehydrogenase [Paenibacillus forsythiae]|uniref:Threonine dehydrogenase-like Zn-dependent dehydrogenase n=1 Tax=Paenibacillus forsythiae TaxID=365616 RepID=A0ABU3HEI5_9BACL|nr:alcohol dehydrogenase catalytic domain-containing protein [Paenibacillus forsythiae]MDT3429229.1 threonine dehydrogenase-like Zn-dependent dehydrogenase [Paenibacillus forsythiae]
MLALVYKSTWDVALEERPVPAITKDNQVLVRIRATGVCGTDLGIVSGKYHAVPSVILGHESAGEVISVGKEVTSLQPGDRVVINPTYYCGHCEMCRTGRENHCTSKSVTETGVSADGTFTDYYITEDRFLYKLKDHVSYEEATLTEPLSCILTGINQIHLLPNLRTVILGAGPIGILYSYALASKGVTGCLVDISKDRLAIAGSIAPERWQVHETFQAAVQAQAPEGHQVDLIVDTTGAVGTQVLSNLAHGGYLMLMGLRDGNSTFNPKEVVDRSLKIIGSIDSVGTFATAHYLIEQGIIPGKKIITHTFPLDQYEQAFQTLGCDLSERTLNPSSQAIKVILQSN